MNETERSDPLAVTQGPEGDSPLPPGLWTQGWPLHLSPWQEGAETTLFTTKRAPLASFHGKVGGGEQEFPAGVLPWSCGLVATVSGEKGGVNWPGHLKVEGPSKCLSRRMEKQ